MMGDHFQHEADIDVVGGTGVSHIREHGIRNFFKAAKIGADGTGRITEPLTCGIGPPHILYAFGLGVNNAQGDFLKGNAGGIIQQVPGHFNCSHVMGNHLDNEGVGDAVSGLHGSHPADHFVQNPLKAFQVF